MTFDCPFCRVGKMNPLKIDGAEVSFGIPATHKSQVDPNFDVVVATPKFKYNMCGRCFSCVPVMDTVSAIPFLRRKK